MSAAPVTARDVELAIMTVARPVSYLPQTLASLFLADPLVWELPRIHLVVGSPDTQYLEDLAHHERLTVHPMPAAEWERIRKWGVHRRLSYNYWRCLSLPSGHLAGMCICEDDVVFREGFVAKLLQAVGEMRRHGLTKYVLAAYSYFDHAAEPGRRRGDYYTSCDALRHFGNCCLFFTPSAQAEAAEVVLRRAVERNELPADLVIGEYGEELWRRGEGGMYQTVSSLAQHVGRTSTGTSGHYYRSPTFDRPWPSG
ncbi:MAG TPA: hypothetical protein VLF66_06750 [Thermoanaerobaculia bacterium]|nr:hypothetical protein [Thermoanaerobaculia bacterium]